MLPPLATLKEEHPVYTLPASRERYGHGEYPSLSSRPMSTKASVATIASIFSMKSGSVGYDPQNSLSYGYSRSHTPSASISSTLPYSNSQSRSGLLSVNIGRRTQGSSSGSTDLRRGHAPSSSVSSMPSQSSVDLRGLSASRHQGNQSSVTKMQSHAPSRTKYDAHVQTRLHKAPSTEELSLGLRAYAGNPYVIAVQAELEGKASKYEVSSKTAHGDDELVFNIRRDDVATSDEDEQLPDEILAGWKLYDFKPKEAGGAEVFEPRSSTGTLRPFAQERQLQSESGGLLSGTNVGLPRASQDGVSTLARTRASGYGDSGRGGAGRDWEGSGGYSGGYTNGYGRRNDSSGSDYGGEQGGAPGGGRRGRDNSRGDDEKWQRERPSVSNSSTSDSESESESESSEDDYGEEKPSFVRQSTATHVSSALTAPAPAHSVHVQRQEEPSSPAIFSQLRNGRRGVYRPPTTSIVDDGSGTRPPTAEDDDVPLAQRPGALKAQKTIRERVKSDRDRRRRERSVAPTSRTSRAPEGTISPPPQYVPGDKQEERGRTILARMPKSAPIGGSAAPLSSSQEAAMMAQKVVPLQHALNIPRRHRAKTLNGMDGSGVPADDLAKRLLKVQSRDTDVLMPTHRTPAGSTTQPQAGAYAHDVITGERPSVIHANSRRSPRSPQVGSQPFQTQQNPADVPAPTRALRPMRSLHGISSAATTAAPAPAPPIPASLGRRSSKGREVNATSDGLMRSRSLKSARTPADKTRRTSAEEAQVLHSHPPVPSAPTNRHNLVQMRVFIGDMQRFNMVEAGLDTSANDVIGMLRHQGDLRNEEHRSRGWTLYEVCQDFGMERPVRSFELVTDISGSWNKDKTLNCFMAKQSPFAQVLLNIPTSIPTRSGFVDYESKKGKWSKRWLELREHGLWLSKREGKEDQFLCSLSAFDAYVVTRIHKATKNFTFAVKSTDPITLFEDKTDYLHLFSVPEDTGLAWVEAIWLARSYIIYQEKNVLFRKNAGENASSGVTAGANLARSGTRKKPAQTYVNLAQPPLPGALPVSGPFEPGSLLAKRTVAETA